MMSFGNFNEFIWRESRVNRYFSNGVTLPPRFKGFREAWTHLKGLPVFALMWEAAPYRCRISWLRGQVEWLKRDLEEAKRQMKCRQRELRLEGENMAALI